MNMVSEFHILSEALCVCQLVFRMTCSHLKPAASRVVYYMAIWVSLLKDSLKAGFLKLLLCGRGERRASHSPVWLYLIAKGDDGTIPPKSHHLLGTISWMRNKKVPYPVLCI